MQFAVEIKLGVQPAGAVKAGFEGTRWMGVPQVNFEGGWLIECAFRGSGVMEVDLYGVVKVARLGARLEVEPERP